MTVAIVHAGGMAWPAERSGCAGRGGQFFLHHPEQHAAGRPAGQGPGPAPPLRPRPQAPGRKHRCNQHVLHGLLISTCALDHLTSLLREAESAGARLFSGRLPVATRAGDGLERVFCRLRGSEFDAHNRRMLNVLLLRELSHSLRNCYCMN